MNKNKKFDAVQTMRDIREKLSERYWKHPDILKKEMEAIRKKYDFRFKTPQDQLT
jgi:hypothetical protein